MAEFLEIVNVSKHFGSLCAVDGVSLSIRKGEFFSLLGPSGCGKTTLLRMLAGFEQPDTGHLLLADEEITPLPPNKRKVNTIFQSYALFPHLTVRQNIAFGLQVQKLPRTEIEAEVDKMLALVQLEAEANKKPAQISGGQKQRVAVARALIMKPQVLLLDEPLAALDLKLRQKMLLELDIIHDEVGITFVYVTHDQSEAMSLSDRIAVMNHGRIEQIGTPAEIYEAPRSSFVAAFIGDTNFFEGEACELVSKEYSRLKIEGFPDLVCFNDKKISAGNPVYLSIRPEKFGIGRTKPVLGPNHNIVPGQVEDVIYLGGLTKYWVRVDEYKIAIYQQHNRFYLDEEPIRWNDAVWIWWHADDGFMLERYSEADEELMSLPPESVGEEGAAG
ncbi:MAG TPA: ABC transporter ATP-binding protein [bacterium]|nr:ABC transporter ATP-binding protein [bacterium]HQG45999.1 ABC transporter ATP-binding protein [bacterium]HQI48540.1 ABC transporter ATP-binding protein [bacterium]HQJ63681.1 ABC transporter ATP-binding protein [bacterium]